MARAAQKMQLLVNSSRRFTIVIYLFYFVFFIIVVVSLFLGDYTYVVYVTILAILVIIVTYMVGFLRLRRLLLEHSSLKSETNVKTARILHNISTTALGISCTSAVFLAMLASYALVGVQHTTPTVPLANYLSFSIYVSGAFMNMVVVRYSYISVMAKLASSKQTSLVLSTYDQKTGTMRESVKESVVKSEQAF